jgi:aromatic-L-amino-acid/L-tryptophan decarboxylase
MSEPTLPESTTLDPDDWDEVRRVFERAVAECLAHTRTVRERPVWRPTPDAVKARFRQPLPRDGRPLPELFAEFEQAILPFGTGNVHPRFWGWVHGSGNVAGALGEMLAAFLNCNAGGRDHIATYVERQVVDWSKEIFQFPATASGLLTTGTSMATLIAVAVARDFQADADVQQHGVAAATPLVAYASVEAHRSVVKAFDVLGLGTAALRLVPVDGDRRIRADELAAQVDADRARGLRPFLVIGSAGTVNTGAIDDLAGLVEFCRENALWLHVDGAFGGLAVLTPEFRPQLAAIAWADSVAFDFHKWLHVPYDAGCVLVRNAAAHRQAFAARPDYLSGHAEGLAAGEPWFCDFGPELSRGFRALKVWFSLKAHGAERYGELISRNCAQARELGALVASQPDFELLASVSLNIVCFRFAPQNFPNDALDELNTRIVTRLQTLGAAVTSTVHVDGKLAIRAAITNHRTQNADLELLVTEARRVGRAIAEEMKQAGFGSASRHAA